MQPQGLDIFRAGRALESAVAKQHAFARPAQDGHPGLLQVGLFGGAQPIVPAAAALGAADATQPTHDEIGLVLHRAAPALVVVIARLRAHPNPIKIRRFASHLITALVEVLVPLGVFDDELHLGIDLPGGREHVAARELHHQLTAVIGPALAGDGEFLVAHGDGARLAGRLALGAGAIREPEVVNHDLIEHPGGVGEDVFDLRLRGGVGVAGDGVLPTGRGLADLGGGDAAGDHKGRRLEFVAGVYQRGLFRRVSVAV